jgi:hypothetical protein
MDALAAVAISAKENGPSAAPAEAACVEPRLMVHQPMSRTSGIYAGFTDPSRRILQYQIRQRRPRAGNHRKI